MTITSWPRPRADKFALTFVICGGQSNPGKPGVVLFVRTAGSIKGFSSVTDELMGAVAGLCRPRNVLCLEPVRSATTNSRASGRGILFPGAMEAVALGSPLHTGCKCRLSRYTAFGICRFIRAFSSVG